MRRLAFALLALASPIAASCALGTERDPGCQSDGECEQGFVCRAGACFRFTTSESPPAEPSADAGSDATDAAGG